MADTVITNTPGTMRSADDSSTTAWIVGLIIVVALLIAGYFVYRSSGRAVPVPSGGSTIQVNVPSGTGGSGSTGQSGIGGTTQ